MRRGLSFAATALGVGCIVLFGSSARPLSADPRLRKGMSIPEVVKILGAPLDRVEHEARREEEWRFEKVTARFHEGTLSTWTSASGAAIVDAPTNPVPAEPSKKKDDYSFAVEEILSEIMKEGPSKDDSTGSPPVPGLPSSPMVPSDQSQ